MKIIDFIRKEVKKGPMHFALFDPDPFNENLNHIGEKAKVLEKIGTKAIMIGGSTSVGPSLLDDVISSIKQNCSLPVILFPGNISGITKKADAIFFMSLLNSRNPYWITGAQVLGAPLVKRSGIEPISMGYLVIEPGGTVSFIGDAKPIPRNKPSIAASYALAAQYFGMSLVYLEAGSGVKDPIPAELIHAVRRSVQVPLIVGGGVRTEEDVKPILKAGADIIVTGTVAENGSPDEMEKKLSPIIKCINSFKR